MAQSYIEWYYFSYFIVNSILILVFYISDKVLAKKNKKLKTVFKVIIVVVMLIYLVLGALISEFTKNIVTQVPLIILGAFLFNTIIIEKGRIVKFLNAEIKYEDIKDTVTYLEKILEKNELRSNTINYICVFKENPLSPIPTNLQESFQVLEVVSSDYLNQYNLAMTKGNTIEENTNLLIEIEGVLKHKKIYYNQDIVSQAANSLIRDEIVKVTNELYIIPAVGSKYNQYIWLESNDIVDSIDATMIKDIARLIY